MVFSRYFLRLELTKPKPITKPKNQPIEPLPDFEVAVVLGDDFPELMVIVFVINLFFADASPAMPIVVVVLNVDVVLKLSLKSGVSFALTAGQSPFKLAHAIFIFLSV